MIERVRATVHRYWDAISTMMIARRGRGLETIAAVAEYRHSLVVEVWNGKFTIIRIIAL